MQQNTKTPPTPADELAYQLESCRKQIADLKAWETQLEAKFIELIGQKDEGAQSQKGAYYRVTTTAKINRRLDVVQFEALKKSGVIPPEAVEALVTVKTDLNTKAYKDLHKTNPEFAAIFDRCVVAKPGKTSIAVKLL
ncbi:DUF7173 family protein [Endozoicomonas acroporae]|uniref:DUF7173 family protein n=1 Tax=Endozoicomonas acroporae TaxID=1701104 RepID=UPI0013CF7C4F|nr:hypothetical protein [Endozoicomonas acroporae]